MTEKSSPTDPVKEQAFRASLANTLNSFSKENGSNTPDFILGDLLADVLDAFDKAVKARDEWHGEKVPPPTVFDPANEPPPPPQPSSLPAQ